jgi:hypothetical protein
MHKIKGLICQYLKGSSDGVKCGVVNRLIRSIEDADIRLCMNRHHEACVYYVLSLRELVLDTADSDRALETL